MPTATVAATSTPDCFSVSAWISPYGDFYSVDFYQHATFAEAMLDTLPGDYATDPVDELEQRGWLHVSDGEIRNDNCRFQPTAAQLDTMGDWLVAHAAHNPQGWFVSDLRDWLAHAA